MRPPRIEMVTARQAGRGEMKRFLGSHSTGAHGYLLIILVIHSISRPHGGSAASGANLGLYGHGTDHTMDVTT